MTEKPTIEQLLADESMLETDPKRKALTEAWLVLEDKMHAALLAKRRGQLDASALSPTLEQASREYASTVREIDSGSSN